MAVQQRPMLGRQPSVPRGSRFETTAWRYMRWSGILLIPLVFIHLAIMHIINSVYVIDYEWVIERRFAYLGWRIYDAFMLWFAGLHGYNGLRYVINDYVMSPGLRRTLMIISIVVLAFVFIVGTIALIGTPMPALQPAESAHLLLAL